MMPTQDSHVRAISNDESNSKLTLLLCFLSSLGVCLAFLPVLSLNSEVQVAFNDLLNTISKASLIVIVLILESIVVHLIRNKNKYHESQVVLWPKRCRHCARALGIVDREVNTAIRHLHQEPQRNAETSLINPSPNSFSTITEFPEITRNASDSEADHIPLTERRMLSMAQSLQDNTTDYWSAQRLNGTSYTFFRRHRSFVNVFNVFCVFAIFGIPIQAIEGLSCLIAKESHSGSDITLAVSYVALLSLIPVATLFFADYHDAFFVANSMNSVIIVILLSGGISLSVLKLVIPINMFISSRDNQTTTCKLNGEFGEFIAASEQALIPYFAECAVIATGIIWQIYSSLIPAHAVRRTDNYSLGCLEQSNPTIAFLKKLIARAKIYVTRLSRLRSAREAERFNLHSSQSLEGFHAHIRMSWLYSIVVCFFYLVASLFLITVPSVFPTTSEEICISWGLEVVFNVPICVIMFLQNRISAPSSANDSPKMKGHLGGHNILLLLCSCGIFCQSTFRLIAGIGLLNHHFPITDECGKFSLGPNYVTMVSFSVIYSIYIIVLIWQITSFLINVQSENIRNPLKLKWVLSCLIYLAVIRATEWIVDSIYVQTWPIHCLYFGKTTGHVTGIIMDPFATLYGLHAAMVAYEAYKTLLQKDEER